MHDEIKHVCVLLPMLHLAKVLWDWVKGSKKTFRVCCTYHPRRRSRNHSLFHLLYSAGCLLLHGDCCWPQAIKVFTELGHPFALLRDALLQQAWPLTVPWIRLPLRSKKSRSLRRNITEDVYSLYKLKMELVIQSHKNKGGCLCCFRVQFCTI